MKTKSSEVQRLQKEEHKYGRLFTYQKTMKKPPE
jgi:hypothetical protein